MKEALKHLHSHPKMERRLNVPEDHVIIDKAVFIALLAAKNDPFYPTVSPGLYLQQMGRVLRPKTYRQRRLKLNAKRRG